MDRTIRLKFGVQIKNRPPYGS